MKYLLTALVIAICGYAMQAEAQNVDSLEAVAATSRPDPQNPVGPNLQVPLGWEVRLDHPDADVTIGADSETADIFFVNMTPGWHITTSPAGIFYHPASTAEGTFRAEMGVFLFNPGNRNEGYGLFVGGEELQGEGQKYLYFLIRRSGEFLIKRRDGADTHVIHSWTQHDAIEPYTEEMPDDEPVYNLLAIEAGEEDVHFLVNGETVATYPRAELDVEGVVGFRLNHRLNVHVRDFSVVQDTEG